MKYGKAPDLNGWLRGAHRNHSIDGLGQPARKCHHQISVGNRGNCRHKEWHSECDPALQSKFS